jgi:hypothetical protein
MKSAGARRTAPDRDLPIMPALAVVFLITVVLPSFVADPRTNTTTSHLLLTDSFGNAVRMSTNEVNSSLHPPAAVGLKKQIPKTPRGAPQSDEVRERIAASGSSHETAEWFPVAPPVLMPYLGSLDEFGFETMYVLQLTPFASIQPDLQAIWNPANNPNPDHNLIFQLQLSLTW